MDDLPLNNGFPEYIEYAKVDLNLLLGEAKGDSIKFKDLVTLSSQGQYVELSEFTDPVLLLRAFDLMHRVAEEVVYLTDQQKYLIFENKAIRVVRPYEVDKTYFIEPFLVRSNEENASYIDLNTISALENINSQIKKAKKTVIKANGNSAMLLAIYNLLYGNSGEVFLEVEVSQPEKIR